MKILPVVLSGGSGTRLWPVSRSDYPKQLQNLIGDVSLLRRTAERIPSAPDIMPPIVVCGEDQRFLVAEHLRQSGVKPTAIVLEPVARSTAPALAVAALSVKDPAQTVLIAMPADHYVAQEDVFAQALMQAARLAMNGKLMTLGITPTRPHTGFGYIQRGASLPEDPQAFVAAKFKEKPDEATACSYVKSGDFFWNAGIFAFRADLYLEALLRFAPDVPRACQEALDRAALDLDFLRLDAESFARSPDISIDYAVMEQAENVAVLPVSFTWSDIGGWPALWQIGQKDDADNVVQGDVVLQETERCYVRAEERLVAAIGLKDIVVVDTADALFIATMDKADEVKNIVARLKRDGRREVKEHRRVWRPWGYYERLSEGPRFQVKRIMVKPGGKLSLQKHHHRAEHWIVVSGTAKVQRDQDALLLGPNESVYLPLGALHRLENPGLVPLDLIEVQSGDYLGEDDIVRLEDVYKRQ